MTARLAAVVDEVGALLARGYDRSQVRDVLVEAGYRFTANSFDSALKQVRKRRSTQGAAASGGGKPGWSAYVENAMSGDTAARGNQSGGGSFSDAFEAREGLAVFRSRQSDSQRKAPPPSTPRLKFPVCTPVSTLALILFSGRTSPRNNGAWRGFSRRRMAMHPLPSPAAAPRSISDLRSPEIRR